MSSSDVTVRFAGSDDLNRLLKLSEYCPGAPQWSAKTWQQVLNSARGAEQRAVLVAESGEALIGFGVMGQTSGQGEIESLAVSSTWRHRGVGRRLCEDLLAWARARGGTEASLEVRISNVAARALYIRLGFTECGMRRGYYRSPVEDALVMTKAL